MGKAVSVTNWGVMGLLTVQRSVWAAYLSVLSEAFVLSASPSASAPLGPTLLSKRLRARADPKCQGLLTVGNEA